MYIDSNIFIYAAVDTNKTGKHCRTIIQKISDKQCTVAASYLILDEVLWILKKQVGKDNAIKITKAMLSLPIKWIEVDSSVIFTMVDIFEKTALDPRDALHIASMKKSGISSILSEDTDFNNIEGITRISVSQFLQ